MRWTSRPSVWCVTVDGESDLPQPSASSKDQAKQASRRAGEVRARRCIVGRRHVETVSPVRARCLVPGLVHTWHADRV